LGLGFRQSSSHMQVPLRVSTAQHVVLRVQGLAAAPDDVSGFGSST
jgi:hypothetical protein